MSRPFRVSMWVSRGGPGSGWIGDVGTYGSLDAARRAAKNSLTTIPGGWAVRIGSAMKIDRRDGVPGHERWGWPDDATPNDLMSAEPVLLTDPFSPQDAATEDPR